MVHSIVLFINYPRFSARFCWFYFLRSFNNSRFIPLTCVCIGSYYKWLLKHLKQEDKKEERARFPCARSFVNNRDGCTLFRPIINTFPFASAIYFVDVYLFIFLFISLLLIRWLGLCSTRLGLFRMLFYFRCPRFRYTQMRGFFFLVYC